MKFILKSLLLATVFFAAGQTLLASEIGKVINPDEIEIEKTTTTEPKEKSGEIKEEPKTLAETLKKIKENPNFTIDIAKLEDQKEAFKKTIKELSKKNNIKVDQTTSIKDGNTNLDPSDSEVLKALAAVESPDLTALIGDETAQTTFNEQLGKCVIYPTWRDSKWLSRNMIITYASSAVVAGLVGYVAFKYGIKPLANKFMGNKPVILPFNNNVAPQQLVKVTA